MTALPKGVSVVCFSVYSRMFILISPSCHHCTLMQRAGICAARCIDLQCVIGREISRSGFAHVAHMRLPRGRVLPPTESCAPVSGMPTDEAMRGTPLVPRPAGGSLLLPRPLMGARRSSAGGAAEAGCPNFEAGARHRAFAVAQGAPGSAAPVRGPLRGACLRDRQSHHNANYTNVNRRSTGSSLTG